MIVWVLATTMPVVMLALWTSVADGGPVGRYGRPQFIAYFLATFAVRADGRSMSQPVRRRDPRPSHSLEKPFCGGLAPKRGRPLPKDSKVTTL
jgi:hypothetical protein